MLQEIQAAMKCTVALPATLRDANLFPMIASPSPLTAITHYVAQVSLTWKPPLSESSKASEIESKETFRTSLSQRGAKVSLDLLKGHS